MQFLHCGTRFAVSEAVKNSGFSLPCVGADDVGRGFITKASGMARADNAGIGDEVRMS
jgi:hypothetical protein